MNPVDALAAVGRVIGDGMTLAAEILCPRDHTAEDRLRSWESASVAVEDEICDEAEADEDYLFTTTWAEYRAKKSDQFEAVMAQYGLSDPSAADSAAADPSPATTTAVPGGAGDEGSGEVSDILQSASPERPGLIECQSPTCGCHGDSNYAPRESDPGAVTSPAPGEQVLEDDLAAHIMGDFVSGQEVDALTATLIDALSSRIASALLSDFTIIRRA